MTLLLADRQIVYSFVVCLCIMQEFPHHLIAIGDRQRLEHFLTQWSTFDELVDDEYSYRLLMFWRQVVISHCYQ